MKWIFVSGIMIALTGCAYQSEQFVLAPDVSRTQVWSLLGEPATRRISRTEECLIYGAPRPGDHVTRSSGRFQACFVEHRLSRQGFTEAGY